MIKFQTDYGFKQISNELRKEDGRTKKMQHNIATGKYKLILYHFPFQREHMIDFQTFWISLSDELNSILSRLLGMPDNEVLPHFC